MEAEQPSDNRSQHSSEGIMAPPGHKSESGNGEAAAAEAPLIPKASKVSIAGQTQQAKKKQTTLEQPKKSNRRKVKHLEVPNSPGFQRKTLPLPYGPSWNASMAATDPNMERYLDDQFYRWTVTADTPTTYPALPIPSTLNPEPNYVRKLSMCLGGPPQSISHRPMPRREKFDFESGGVNDDNFEESSSWLDKFKKSKASSKTRRVCEKDGDANVKYRNISEKRRRYVSDIYTTLVDSSWSASLFLFATSFYLTWLVYAVLYYIICYCHGDFEPDHLPSKQSDSGWVPCIWEIDGFAAAFLFSLETQHTIGYGSRQTTTECTEAMIVMSTQSIIGCLIQAFMVGLVFAKLSTPNKRAKTVVFSKNAVICERDKKLCLVFRVGDMRPDSFIVGAQLSAKIIRRRVTDEGEMFHDVAPINISPDSSSEPCIFLIWPITVLHVLDEDSPFYKMSAPELASDKFEIHVVLEGTIEATSMTFQARTSYLPNEILWGHRFEPMMIYRRDHNKYQVNFSAFNSTYEVDTPLCSSYDLGEHYKKKKSQRPSGHQSLPLVSSPASIHGFPSNSVFPPSAYAAKARQQRQPMPPEDDSDNEDVVKIHVQGSTSSSSECSKSPSSPLSSSRNSQRCSSESSAMNNKRKR